METEVWVKNEAIGSSPFKVKLQPNGVYDDLKKAIKNNDERFTFAHHRITIKNPDGSAPERMGAIVQYAASDLSPYLFTIPAGIIHHDRYNINRLLRKVVKFLFLTQIQEFCLLPLRLS